MISAANNLPLQIVDRNGIRDITPEGLKGTPVHGPAIQAGQGQAPVVVAA